jgi:CheY-like chemotaxis protein
MSRRFFGSVGAEPITFRRQAIDSDTTARVPRWVSNAAPRLRGNIVSHVVAIPARNEECRIAACLDALDAQVGASVDCILLYANNCTDHTADVTRKVHLSSGAKLFVVEEGLPPARANAGYARRRAMEIAVPLAGSTGVLYATDGDGRVDPFWLANTSMAMTGGADAFRLMDDADCVSIVVTDYNMPGFDGVDVAKRARARHPAMPVLFISARPDVLAGADPPQPCTVLRKPFTMKALEQAVDELWNERER